MNPTTMRRIRIFLLFIALFAIIVIVIFFIIFIVDAFMGNSLPLIFTLSGIGVALLAWLLPLPPNKYSNSKQVGDLPINTSNPISTNQMAFTNKLRIEDEIKLEVKNVVKEVEQAQDITINQDDLKISKEVSDDINEVLHTARTSPRAALLLLSAKIEGQMRSRLQEADLQSSTNFTLSQKAINQAVSEGLIPEETISAFRDFVAVRNKVAHDQAFDVDEATILSLVSIGIELLKIVSARKQEDGETHKQ